MKTHKASQEEHLIINRYVPLLLKRLLQSEEEDETYQACRQFAFAKLRHHGYGSLDVKYVFRKLSHFMDRYRIERMSEFGNTFFELCDVIMKSPLWLHHSRPDLGWSLMDFMLSTNYDSFRTVRRFRREMEAQRKVIVEAVEYMSELESKDCSESTGEINWLASVDGHPEALRLEPGIYSKLAQPTPDLPLLFEVPQMFALLAEKAKLKRELSLAVGNTNIAADTKAAEVVSPAVRKSCGWSDMFLPRLCRAELEEHGFVALDDSDKVKKSSDELTQSPAQLQLAVQLKPEASPQEALFECAFAGHMRKQLGNMSLPRFDMTAECRLMRELLIMYFVPDNCYYFQLTDSGIRVRNKNNPTCMISQHVMGLLESQVMPTLQYMQALRLFIYAPDKPRMNVLTLTCMRQTVACLLRPVVERLIDFEKHLSTQPEHSSLEDFLRYLKQSLQRLACLCAIKDSSHLSTEAPTKPHIRTLYTLADLQLQLSKRVAQQRSCAATVLLHVLKPYCDFVDRWWQTGSFNDVSLEFLACRSLKNRLTVYELRPVEDSKLRTPLYHVLAEHIEAAGPSISLLMDILRLKEFTLAHGALFKQTLHVSFMECVLQLLVPYQLNAYGFCAHQTEAKQHILRLNNPKLSELFRQYLQHTTPDPLLPVGCTAERLLYSFDVARSYAPFGQLIVSALKRQLEQRTVLLNAFVMHLLMGKLQVGDHLNFVRSTFLLQNFNIYESNLSMFYLFLEQRQFAKAVQHLKRLIHSNQRFGLLFEVQLSLTTSMQHSAINVPQILDQMSLNYLCNAALARIISTDQLRQYNDTFRLLLKAQWAAWKLKHFPPMPEVSLILHKHTRHSISCLRSMKFKLISNFNALHIFSFKNTATNSLICADLGFFQCSSLQQLQQVHAEFLKRLSNNWQLCSLQLGLDNGLQELLSRLNLVDKLWVRLRDILTGELDNLPNAHQPAIQLEFDEALYAYLQSLDRLCAALQCMFDAKFEFV